MEKTKKSGITSSALHIIAMAFMLCDHLWAKIVPGNDWLTCIGRLAFPIFAFMIAEGFSHTSDVKKYLKRLLVLAVISEIPFNLMYSGTIVYPFHQNVMWTLSLGLVLIYFIDSVRKKGKIWLTVPAILVSCILGWLAGYIAMIDYYGAGVLTVIVFYLFHGKKWWCFAGQLLCLWYINVEMLGGLYYPVEIFGHSFGLVQQSLALLSLVFIWLYNGQKGCSKKWFRNFCYAFYPVHMLIIALAVIF
ncbi:MAG: conjugal transfer protein TraX [Oscillospiraceae bacterium]|nr:conjugal transfer protein TraX [Oscillospiraceae bacterium]